MVIKRRYPIEVTHTYSARQQFNDPKYHWKKWGGFDSLTKEGGEIICGTGNYPRIATKSGTYNTPAPIYVNFGKLGIENGEKLEKITLCFKQKKICTSEDKSPQNFPIFGAPTVRSYNEEIENNKVKAEVLTGVAPSSEYVETKLVYTKMTVHDVNVHDFGFIIRYPANTSSNEGRLAISDVYLEIETNGVDATFSAQLPNKEICEGETFEITLNVTQNDSNPYTPVFDLNFGEGIEFMKIVRGTGTVKDVSTDPKKHQWQWTSTLTNKKATVTLLFRATKVGTWNFSMLDSMATSKKFSLNISVSKKKISFKTTCRLLETPNIKRVKQGERAVYTIEARTSDSIISELPLEIHFPISAEFENKAELIDENEFKLKDTKTERIVTLNMHVKNQLGILIMDMTFNDSGVYPITITYGGALVDTCLVTVLPVEYDHIAFTRQKITDEDVIESLSTDLDYTAISYAKYVYKQSGKEAELPKLDDYQVRFGVYNGDENVSNDIFLENTTWCSSRETQKLDEFRVKFHYNAKYPVYFVWTIDYIESPFYENITVEFTEPELYETKSNKSYNQAPALYAKPLINHIKGKNYYAEVNLPAKKSTTVVRCHNFNEEAVFRSSKKVVCQGLQVEWDYEVNQQVEIVLEVRVNTFNAGTVKGSRSITLPAPGVGQNTRTGTEAIGGQWDLYGISPHHFRSDTLNYLWLDVKLNNPTTTDAHVKISNIKLRLFLMDYFDYEYGFEIDGERAEDYGIFFKKMTWDWGTQNDVNYYQTSGTDMTTAYRSNITKKELTLDFNIGNCDLEESGILLEKVVKLFTNKRTLFNKPIPKRIIFDHLPEYEFWFVREDAMEVEEEYGMYNVTCKLVIPEGTARNRAISITGTTGANTGIARVTPSIEGIVNKNGIITINEVNSDQSMIIKNKDEIKEGYFYRIECSTRKVYLTPPNSNITKDITASVQWNSQWFILEDEYQFKSPDSNITSIRFKERQ